MTTVQTKQLAWKPAAVAVATTAAPPGTLQRRHLVGSAASAAPTNSSALINACAATTRTGARGLGRHRSAGATVHIDLPKKNQLSSRVPLRNSLRSSLPSTAASDKKAEIEQQQHNRASPALQRFLSETPRSIKARPSVVYTTQALPRASQNKNDSSGNSDKAVSHPHSTSVTMPSDPVGVKGCLTLPLPVEASLLQGSRHQPKTSSVSAALLLDADQESSEPPRGVTKEQLAAVAADARQQLGQPTYVTLTARQIAAEQRWQQSHSYDRIVQNLHERLGVVTPKPLEVVADVTDKAIALRRAEMAEMVARLRRLILEANIAGVPIIPAASLGASGTPCPPCQYCIELTSEETIKKYLIAALQVIVSERVVVPMAGRHGPTSVMSNDLSGGAATLDSFRAHKSRAHRRPAEAVAPARFSVPRCFRVELVPLGLQKVSLHVSVHDNLAEHFFKAHARQQEHPFSFAIDPPFPREWAEWTDAHRQRLLHRVLVDLLHGGATPAVPVALKTVALFPAHVDIIRDALWSSVWSARSLKGWLTISEDAVASYLGEEVMFYYAWMNHYARWLLGTGLLGVLVSMLSSLRLASDAAMAAVPDKVVRSAGTTLVLAPAASSSMTLRRTVQYCPDVALLPLGNAFMVIASVLCIKMWERRCSVLCMKYHLFQQEEDELKHDSRGTPGANSLTGESQLCHPTKYQAMLPQSLTWGVVALFMAGSLGLMVCSLNLDGMVSDPASRLAIPSLRRLAADGGLLDKTVHPIAALFPSLVYSVCIAALSFTFKNLAKHRMRIENYRDRGEYVRALTLKRVAFELFNSYGKLLFIVFGRGSISELASQLQIIFYVAAVSRMMSDTIVPLVVTHRRRVVCRLFRTGSVEPSSRPSHTSQFTPVSLPLSAQGGSSDSPLNEVDEMPDLCDIYMDFIEVLIQFGFILLFAAAYPLVSFVALLSNIIKVRSHLFTMCYVMRRPVPRLGVQQNTTWCGIMRGFAIAAVIINTFLLALMSNHTPVWWLPKHFTTISTLGSQRTSDKLRMRGSGSTAAVVNLNRSVNPPVRGLETMPGKGRIVAFDSITIEHVMCLIAIFLLWCIPSTPREVRYYKTGKLRERMTLQ
ncbi:Calcium-activated_chloride_channel (plasmid) [Leishmania braziliensis MHOM/BR/75/M2904]|nr:Calcium-activated_chloride_channel [Leishmania braziliensis MHOM/BR/75/M2904]